MAPLLVHQKENFLKLYALECSSSHQNHKEDAKKEDLFNHKLFIKKETNFKQKYHQKNILLFNNSQKHQELMH